MSLRRPPTHDRIEGGLTLLRLGILVILLVPTLAHARAALEDPRNGAFYSGIGVIRGWKCEVNGALTVRFNGGASIPLVSGSRRPDILDAGACVRDDVGFVAIWNWANLGDGTHTAVAYDNGVEFARSTFTVTTLGEEYVRGASGECTITDFPASGEAARFTWNVSTQHLELTKVRHKEPSLVQRSLSKVYWIHDLIYGSILRANLDGSQPETLASGDGNYMVGPLILDVTGGKMYWRDSSEYTYRIRRANLDGSQPETLASGDFTPFVGPLVLDVTGDKMYWRDYDSDASPTASPKSHPAGQPGRLPA